MDESRIIGPAITPPPLGTIGNNLCHNGILIKISYIHCKRHEKSKVNYNELAAY